MALRTRQRGMTLIEMMTAVVILLIMTGIVAQVFYQATKAAGKGKALGEVYQVSRALQSLLTRDISGATPDFFAGGENGEYVRFMSSSLPPGPYAEALSGAPFGNYHMQRMLMGGSDYLVMTSSGAAGSHKGVAKVFYVLRATGELVRVTYADANFTLMDYLLGAVERNVDLSSDLPQLTTYEEQRVVAENVTRVKFQFLDRSTGGISEDGLSYAYGVWLDRWDWNQKDYLPAAVKIELQLVDHFWTLRDDDLILNKNFKSGQDLDALRASENFDPDDGENFRFIVNIPLGMKSGA